MGLGKKIGNVPGIGLFKGLKVTGVPSDDGDKAFDEEEFAAPSLPGLQVVSL